jgi:methyl-accepting chemotaxis protein
MPNDAQSLGRVLDRDELDTIADCISGLSSMLLDHSTSAKGSLEYCAEADQALMDSLVNITTAIGALEEIRSRGQNIAEIVELVKEIAFQSRMLSLNAAVEAAHAGEAGKGFAIVAQEVRNLANRSAKASIDIQRLTSDILNKIDDGCEAVDNTAGDIAGIRGHIEDTKSSVSGLADGVANQRNMVDDLRQVISALEKKGQPQD